MLFEVQAARLLDGVDLQAKVGEFIGIIGPNGAGKSTLLKTVSGLLRRQQGTVSLLGRDLDGMSRKEIAQSLAMVPQTAPYTYGFTGLEIVVMGRYPHMGRFEVEGVGERRVALEALRMVEAEQFAHRAVTSLSGGERQRVFIARALAQQPKIMLLDEPTAGLDVQHQLKTMELIKSQVAQGMTAVAAIHDLPLAARYCHRLVLLHRGRVLAQGLPHEVLTPDHIQAAFGVRAVVYPDPLTGSLTVSLLDPSPRVERGPGPARVHVVCGAGSGARIMHDLKEAGFTVSAGVLGAGDTDRAAADILGVEYVPVPAFGGIDDAAHAAHIKLVKAADVVVLSETPFGVNNLRNLQAAAEADRLVCLETRPFAERDHTGGQAQRIYSELRPSARCRHGAEVVTAVGRLVGAEESARIESIKS